jgi:hypothetical protein
LTAQQRNKRPAIAGLFVFPRGFCGWLEILVQLYEFTAQIDNIQNADG